MNSVFPVARCLGSRNRRASEIRTWLFNPDFMDQK